MSIRLLGPLYDLSARGELFRRFCYLFLKFGYSFSIRVVPEEFSKVYEDSNLNALKQYVADEDTEAKTVINFCSFDKSDLVDPELTLERKKIFYFYGHSINSLDESREKYLLNYDSVWAANMSSVCKVLKQKKFSKLIEIVPVPVNLEDKTSIVNLNINPVNSSNLNKDTFIFYSIGRFTERNNIRALLEAYWSAFTSEDNVCLLLKTHINGTNSDVPLIKDFIDYCMEQGKFSKSPHMAIFHETFTREMILGLHKLGNCYVSSKRADYLNLNIYDAQLFENFIIQPTAIANSNISYDTCHRPVFSESKNYFYPNQMWMDANVESLSKSMRKIFDDRKCYKNHSKDKRELLEHSDENVLKVIRQLF